jgi:hypothetical protein
MVVKGSKLTDTHKQKIAEGVKNAAIARKAKGKPWWKIMLGMK